jgi:hypothetical protein
MAEEKEVKELDDGRFGRLAEDDLALMISKGGDRRRDG